MKSFLLPEKFNRVKRILRLVLASSQSSFYRKKYGLSAKRFLRNFTPDSFSRLPYLDRDELVNISPVKLRYFNTKKIAFIQYSSATWGKPLLFYKYRHRENEEIITRLKDEREYLNDINCVFLLVHPKKVPSLYTHYRRSLKKVTVIGDMSDMELASVIAAKAEIDMIVTGPERALRFANFLNKNYNLKRIKQLRLFSNHVSQLHFKKLKEYFRRARINISYGMSEVGYIGIQCKYLMGERDVYHISPQLLVEVVNHRSGASLPIGKLGEIAVTTTKLGRASFPFLRYRTGDLGILENRKCRCGRGDILRVLGKKETTIAEFGKYGCFRETLAGMLLRFSRYLTGNTTLFFSNHKRPRIVLFLEQSKVIPKNIQKIIYGSVYRRPLFYTQPFFYKKLDLTLSIQQAISQKIFSSFELKFVRNLNPSFKKWRDIVDARVDRKLVLYEK